MRRFTVAALLALLSYASLGQAQIAYPNKEGVSMGHVHLLVADPAAAAKFFETIGGLPAKVGDNVGVKFLDVVILLRQGAPSGPAVGSSVGHIGFTVPNTKKALAEWNAAGLKTTTEGADAPGGFSVLTPDGQVRIEVSENDKQIAPIRFTHVHLYTAEKAVPEMQAWYAKMFGATPATRGRNVSADIPGVSLSFTPSEGGQAVAPTKGRAIDHIGFEVVNLEAFAKKLEGSGVKFDTPYTKGSAPGLMIAFFTDPWGTNVELTEGLRASVSR